MTRGNTRTGVDFGIREQSLTSPVLVISTGRCMCRQAQARYGAIDQQTSISFELSWRRQKSRQAIVIVNKQTAHRGQQKAGNLYRRGFIRFTD
jgi:hypothetical protein